MNHRCTPLHALSLCRARSPALYGAVVPGVAQVPWTGRLSRLQICVCRSARDPGRATRSRRRDGSGQRASGSAETWRANRGATLDPFPSPCSVLDVARLQPDSPTHPLADETHNSDRPSLCTFPLSADNCSDPAVAREQLYQGHYSMQRAVLRACRSAAARSANVPRARHFSRTVSSLTHTAAVSTVPSRYACPQQNVYTPLVPCLTMPQEIDTDSCESPDRFWTASKLCQQDGQGPDHGGIALRGHPETVDQTGG